MSVTEAIERLRAMAAAGELLAQRLLARIGDCPARSGLTVQPPIPLTLYIEHPDLAPVRFRTHDRLGRGEPLRRMLSHFAVQSWPQRAVDIAKATGLTVQSVRNVLDAGEYFIRDGDDPLLWSQRLVPAAA